MIDQIILCSKDSVAGNLFLIRVNIIHHLQTTVEINMFLYMH